MRNEISPRMKKKTQRNVRSFFSGRIKLLLRYIIISIRGIMADIRRAEPLRLLLLVSGYTLTYDVYGFG